tara:strand:+ start:214 stop:507 length:294 start_codon:yes stop_codon:yes gene_type:complete
MSEHSLNASDSEISTHHWFPFLRFKKKFEEAGKEVNINNLMRETGQLDEQIAHEESVALAEKITAEKEENAKNEIEKEALKKKKDIKRESKGKTKLE